ncbi:MAG: ethylbenzene dehydrogenase-related protein, partial [Pseudomonadota bacterium]
MKFIPQFSALSLVLSGIAGASEMIEAVHLKEAGSFKDPKAAYWSRSQPLQVSTLPQVVATPNQVKPTVLALQVRAVHNGQWLGFLIEWQDPTLDNRLMIDKFGDQVAVELPTRYVQGGSDPMPSPMMGNPGGRVSIMQWRAAFQQDLVAGEPKLRDLYPYAWVDVYPDQVMRTTDARPYMGAVGLDNPISHPLNTPVLDQMAEGWGSLTVKPEQNANGWGHWKDGWWHVAITRPLVSRGDNDPQLQPGNQTVA